MIESLAIAFPALRRMSVRGALNWVAKASCRVSSNRSGDLKVANVPESSGMLHHLRLEEVAVAHANRY